MGFSVFRVALGVLLMAVVCSVSFAIGGRGVRRVTLAIAVCWVAATALQLLARSQWPGIIGDVACGLFILVLAARQPQLWLWILVVVEAGLLILHALLFTVGKPATMPEIVGNNLLVCAGLLVLLMAAVRDRLGRKPLGS